MKIIQSNLVAAFALVLASTLVPNAPAAAGDDEVSLRSIMQKLDRDTLRSVSALMAEDWHALDQSASAIADHARPPLTERMRILSALGARAGDFKNYDGVVHDAAISLGEAARAADADAAVESMSTMLRGCVACHSAFREDVLKLRENQAERN